MPPRMIANQTGQAIQAENNEVQPAELSFTDHLYPALCLLRRAYLYASHANRSVWDFAVEIDELRTVGLSNLDFRWLTCKDFVQHGRETSKPGESQRSFVHETGLIYGSRTCFALTVEGFRYASSVVHSKSSFEAPIQVTPPTVAEPQSPPSRAGLVPKWDLNRHQLFFAGSLVKEFQWASPNQEAVLTAFEEEGWPSQIDDPLIPVPDVEPKERLRNTVKSLNRKQNMRLIRFRGDGTGQAVRWESTLGEGRPTAGLSQIV